MYDFAVVEYRFQWHPQLARYSPRMAHALARIHEVLGRVEVAPILPSTREALRFSAKAGTIHFSTMVEGNRLSMADAEAAIRGLLSDDGLTREERELVNYANALQYIDDQIEAHPGTCPNVEQLLELHRLTTEGLGSDELGPFGESFTAEHVGVFRPGDVVITDEVTGQVLFVGPPANDVEPLIEGLFEWLEARWNLEVEWPAPVLSGLAHYRVTEVHPFADGNGRVARLLAYWVMSALGYMPHRIFNLDAHYGKNKQAYLAARRAVKQNTNSLNAWVEYFLDGAADEYEYVAAMIDRLLAVSGMPDGKTQLTAGQQRGLLWLHRESRELFTAGEYERAAGVAASTAKKEISGLRERGIVAAVDGQPGWFSVATAQVAKPADGAARAERARVWDDETIESALRSLVGSSGQFPTQKEFAALGYAGLYQAIQRGDGSRVWSERLGIRPPRRGRPRKLDK